VHTLSLSLKAPGGRSNAKMITKSTFKEFSSPHPDGNYFLRPDRILGVFHIELENRRNHHTPLVTETETTTVTTAEMMVEKNRELKVNQVFELADSKQISNTLRIDDAIALIWAEEEKKKNMNMEKNMKITNSSSSSMSHHSSTSSTSEVSEEESSASAMSKDIEMNVKMQHTTPTTTVNRDEGHGSQGETYNQMLNISPLIQEAPTYI
jgi:hypothetical protein